MHLLNLKKLVLFLIVCSLHQFSYSDEVAIRAPSGETLYLNVQPDDSFQEVIHQLQDILGIQDSVEDQKQLLLDFSYDVSTLRSAGPTRNYSHQLTRSEREEIRYIIKTMAKSSWAQLLTSRSSLKKAGDRIAHLHPYRFVECIFTDEELKAGLHSIQDRKRVWDGFYDGLADSLTEESARKNLRPEFLEDFARILKIDVKLISGSIEKQDWNEFIQLLLKHLPRSGDPNRYKM